MKTSERSSETSLRNDASGMTRREFARTITALAALGYLDSQVAAFALETDRNRLGWNAFKTAGTEGAWKPTDIEGVIPKDLRGTLYRTAPGQSENHGVKLKHLFDGDAYVTGWTFDEGTVGLRAQFVQTPQRLKELEAGKMLFGEYGTMPPEPPTPEIQQMGGKNQPSVNIIPFDGRLLGLSEGGHPTAIDPITLDYKGRWDFHGTLPGFVTMTAHPKYDPNTGEAYCYGNVQGPNMGIKVYRMEPTGKLTELHFLKQPGYFMVHDMLMSKNHLIFAIPPVRYELSILLSGKGTVADALRYFEEEPLRFIICSRDGSGEPITVTQPANMVYHHGNAFERDGKLVLDSLLSPDNSVNEMLFNWSNDKPMDYQQAGLSRIEIDLATKEVVSREARYDDVEFPRFDIRKSGEDVKILYAAENVDPSDPLAMTRLVKLDNHTGKAVTADAEKGRALGEPIFVPREGATAEADGWLLQMGYDLGRDETYLEIRDADTLDFQARIWAGAHLPLGFHGNFVPDWKVMV